MSENKAYLSKLNKNQMKAATATGNVCVIAGAGTGKTQTLTAAVIDKIDNRNISPDRIFISTFTKKASNEMSERIKSYDFDPPKFLGTFHSNARKLIQRFPVLAGGIDVDKLTILDMDESTTFAKDNVITKLSDEEIKELCDLVKDPEDNEEEYTIPPRKSRKKKTLTIKAIAKLFRKFISDMKSANINQEQLINFKASTNYHLAKAIDENPIGHALCTKYYNMFCDSLSSQNAMDFDDLIRIPVSVLKDNIDLRRRVSECFDVVMIDEDQDTNIIQNDFVDMISMNASDNGTFFRVGDDGQSIYGWRGSEVSILRNFQDEADVVIALEENYRSTQNILDYSRGILRNDTESNDKVLIASGNASEIKHPKQIRNVNIFSGHKISSEAEFIANEISRRVRDDLDPSDIAVLARSNNAAKQVHRRLIAKSIPSTCDDDDLLKMLGVRFIIAFGLIGLYPDDVINAVRLNDIFNNKMMPVEGVGEKAIDKMVANVHKAGNFKEGMLASYEKTKQAGKLMIDSLFEFSKFIEENWLSKGREPLAEELFVSAFKFSKFQDRLTDRLFELEDKLRYVTNEKGKRKEREQLESEQESLNKTLEHIKEFMEMIKDSSVKDALDQILLSKKSAEDKENGNSVNVMTIHRSKGLEFPVVYVLGMDDESIFKGLQGKKREWFEAIRVLYVAFTRAKRELIITGSPVSSIIKDLENDHNVKREMIF